MGHLAVRVRDLDAVEEVATEVIGLSVSERSSDGLWLTHGTPHHSLHYIAADENAVDHVGLVAPDADALAEVRRRVEAAGFEVVRDGPDGPGVKDGFAFAGVEGAVFEIYCEIERVEPRVEIRGVPPLRFGHVNFSSAQPAAMQRMLIELLDFRVSDHAGPDGAFLRCNVDHHGVGVFPGTGLLHHCAWEVSSIVELGQLADLLDRRGGAVLWGPMRHGIGRNIATYFKDPSGLVVEYYADMERIYDDDHHEPNHWDLEGSLKWLSLWGQQMVPEEFLGLGLPYSSGTEE